MKLKNGQTILFTGDSITDCGRARPVGQGDGLGEGYVAFASAILASVYPRDSIKILNTGISGNRVTDLKARWQMDVLSLKPAWLSVLIGINDVWKQFESNSIRGPVAIEQFESVYSEILDQVRPGLTGLVLMTPYLIEPSLSDPMRKYMDNYGRVVKDLAEKFDAVFVDVQAAFDSYLVHRSSQSLCADRVHPNKTGHMIIAETFLRAIGFEW